MKFEQSFSTQATETPERKKRSATARWGGYERTFEAGFLVVPVKYLARYSALNLNANEAMFVLQLMTFKWDDADPYPTYGSIAQRMGVSEKMARRYAKSLEQKGWVRRKFRHRSANRFDLSPLLEAIAKLPAGANVKRGMPGRRQVEVVQLAETNPARLLKG